MSDSSIIQSNIKGGLANTEVKTSNKLPKHDYPDHLFPLHTLGVFMGARNSGKTNSCVLLIQDYLKHHTFNHIYILSPTYDANPSLQTLPVKKEDVYEDSSSVIISLNDILKKIKNLADDYEEDKRYKEVYSRWRRKQHSFKDQIELEIRDFKPPLDTPRPCCAIVIDDMSHTDIYSTSRRNPFINLCLRHRHIFSVGVSIFMLVQTFRSGVPKALRQNIQQFFIWKTHDIESLEGMYQEFGNITSFDSFLEVYDEATKEPHTFLTVDPYCIDQEHRFRKNFNIYLTISNPTSLLQTMIRKEKNKSKRQKIDPSTVVENEKKK
jgi:hypothetical protein